MGLIVIIIIDHDGSETIVIVDHLLLPLDWVFMTMVDGTSIQHVALLWYVTNNMQCGINTPHNIISRGIYVAVFGVSIYQSTANICIDLLYVKQKQGTTCYSVLLILYIIPYLYRVFLLVPHRNPIKETGQTKQKISWCHD